MNRTSTKRMGKMCLDCEVALVCITERVYAVYECSECGRKEAEIDRDAGNYASECFYHYASDRCPRVTVTSAYSQCEGCRENERDA